MATKIRPRRRGEPTAPAIVPDEQLASMRPDEIERERAAHAAWAKRIEARDPGAGLAPAQAMAAREGQLAELERHVAEAERLRTAGELREREESFSGLARTLRRAGLRKAAASDEDTRRLLGELRERMAERAEKAELKRRLAELRERRLHPANPAARSIAAAVMASDELWAAVRRLPRRVQVVNEQAGVLEDGHVREATLELVDVGLLLALLRALEERGSVIVQDLEGAPRLLIPDLSPVERLRAALRRLERAELISVEREGGSARIDHGSRTLEIARMDGVPV